MVQESSLRGVIGFLNDIGVYDVVLPFLLVFTIMFAVLEKTRILGTEEIDGKRYPKKNLNSMVAFVSAFFVIASTQLVAIINETVANATLILLLLVLFLLLIGTFYKEGEDVFLEGAWRLWFTVAAGIALLLIALNAVGWLDDIGSWLSRVYQQAWFGALVLIIFVAAAMALITRDSSRKSAGKSS